ncbi:MAG: phage integrase SAM-like domain-containing protein [Cyclobacteriaceae bacterium]|nr:phage integrase SAM-like domain-containing protein [Cyclobacteriaceae bacterium]
MAKTKLFIRPNNTNREGRTVIYLRYSHKDVSKDFSTNEMIEPKYWDAKNQQVRKSYKGAVSLNNYLQKRKMEIDEVRLRLQTNGIDPTVDMIRSEFSRVETISQQPVAHKSMLDYWSDFMHTKIKVERISGGSIRQYRATLTTLKNFEEFSGSKLEFDKIDNSFYEQYTFYLYEHLENNPNSVGNRIKQLKCFLAFAVDKELTINLKFKKFKKPSCESFSVALSIEQLNKIYHLDLSDHKKLEETRDLFMIGCSSGFRFSDFKEIKPANIQGDFLTKFVNKTREQIRIPLNDYSRGILQKYPNGLPKASHTFNKDLKIIARRAGLTEIIEITKRPGGKIVKEYVEFWTKVSSHCARRTFASQSLDRGLLITDIMKITLHKDTKTFLKYVKNSEPRLKDVVTKAWSFNNESKDGNTTEQSE